MLTMQLKVSESRWTMPVVSLAMVGLLMLFYAVVSGATKTAELRRQAMAAQSAALLQCNALRNWDARKHCRESLGTVQTPGQEPTLLASQ